MSRFRNDAVSSRHLASSCHSWTEAAQSEQISSLFKPGSSKYKVLDQKIRLTDQAYRMLCALNDFDREKVAEELLEICKRPNDINADVGRRNWFARLARTKYPFKGYHYKIQYAVQEDNYVLINDIFFDKELLGPQPNPGLERNALYQVEKTGTAKFSKDFSRLADNSAKVLQQIESSWETNSPIPTHRVETRFAAVNGMQNDLVKAAWLMGTHLEVAYSQDEISEYTLFHNPSDGGTENLFECLYDKRFMPARSHNIHHFAAVLHDTQKRGQKTHWVAHSQGAIIFSRAVSLASKKYAGSLNCHSVSLHGSGCNLANARRVCIQAGVRIDNVSNNPFDLVPNIAGGNDLSRSGLVRSMKFKGLVLGDDPLASPHTLPYLGLETFIDQLEFTGNHDHARYARKFRP